MAFDFDSNINVEQDIISTLPDMTIRAHLKNLNIFYLYYDKVIKLIDGLIDEHIEGELTQIRSIILNFDNIHKIDDAVSKKYIEKTLTYKGVQYTPQCPFDEFTICYKLRNIVNYQHLSICLEKILNHIESLNESFKQISLLGFSINNTGVKKYINFDCNKILLNLPYPTRNMHIGINDFNFNKFILMPKTDAYNGIILFTNCVIDELLYDSFDIHTNINRTVINKRGFRTKNE